MTESVFSNLKGKLDVHEGFVSGHQIVKTAGATQHAARMSRVPVWALDDILLKTQIEKKFPKMSTDADQKAGAIRAIRIVHLYYRMGLTAAAVAEELGIKRSTVRRFIQHCQEHGLRPRGRPKMGTIQTVNEESLPSGPIL